MKKCKECFICENNKANFNENKSKWLYRGDYK